MGEMLESKHLLQIANTRMPFGKYSGRALIDLPEEYLLWLRKQGFPKGALGELLAWTLELKIEGLEKLVKPLKGKKLARADSLS